MSVRKHRQRTRMHMYPLVSQEQDPRGTMRKHNRARGRNMCNMTHSPPPHRCPLRRHGFSSPPVLLTHVDSPPVPAPAPPIACPGTVSAPPDASSSTETKEPPLLISILATCPGLSNASPASSPPPVRGDSCGDCSALRAASAATILLKPATCIQVHKCKVIAAREISKMNICSDPLHVNHPSTTGVILRLNTLSLSSRDFRCL